MFLAINICFARAGKVSQIWTAQPFENTTDDRTSEVFTMQGRQLSSLRLPQRQRLNTGASDRSQSRVGLRPNASTIRNEAELIDAYSATISKKYTSKDSAGISLATSKDYVLNKRLRSTNLDETGYKRDKCMRLASFIVHKNSQQTKLESFTF